MCSAIYFSTRVASELIGIIQGSACGKHFEPMQVLLKPESFQFLIAGSYFYVRLYLFWTSGARDGHLRPPLRQRLNQSRGKWWQPYSIYSRCPSKPSSSFTNAAAGQHGSCVLVSVFGLSGGSNMFWRDAHSPWQSSFCMDFQARVF